MCEKHVSERKVKRYELQLQRRTWQVLHGASKRWREASAGWCRLLVHIQKLDGKNVNVCYVKPGSGDSTAARRCAGSNSVLLWKYMINEHRKLLLLWSRAAYCSS